MLKEEIYPVLNTLSLALGGESLPEVYQCLAFCARGEVVAYNDKIAITAPVLSEGICWGG